VNFSPSSQRRKQHQPPFLFRARPAAGGSFDRAALPRPPSAGRELAVDIAIAAPTEATHLLFTCVTGSKRRMQPELGRSGPLKFAVRFDRGINRFEIHGFG
jgi:hypothetical protein